jgi:(5-formylfuran-3-yl)methyl phosphate transaminase
MGISQRAKEIPAFIAMDVLEHAQELEAQGRDIIYLCVGEPDFDTPQCVKDAACKAMDDNLTHYTHSLGIMELRKAVAGYHKMRFKVEVDPTRVMITCGVSPAMLLLFSALLEPGDEVIISDPAYACYDNFINFVGGEVVRVPVREDDAFQLRPEEIAKKLSPRTKAILINSPANPTGQLLSPERMRAIADMAPGNDGPPYVVSDEIYHGLVYEGEERCILEFTDNAFVLNGFSKIYAMTGWRLGYVIAPPHYVRPLQKMHQNFAICAPSLSQWAGVAALSDPRAQADVERMRERYNARRLRLVEGLKALGLGIKVTPTGAFYVLARADHIDPDDYRLAFDILDKAGVAVTPGRDFGPGGHGYLRFSYANSLANIEEALNRLADYLAQR